MLCLLGTTLVFASANLIAKLVFQLELSAFLETLELHAFECAIILVCHGLGFEELGDRLEGLGLKFPDCRNELVAVVLVEQHVEPLER